MKIRWTADASAQLDEVLLYIGEHNPVAAESWLAALVDALEAVSKFPLSGRINPDCNDELLRETLVGPYRVGYLIYPDAIEVVMIWHGARMPPGRGIAGTVGDE
jgi:toxin ParE1/3/4